MSKIAIVGYGFVGKATEYFFANHIKRKPPILIHDPALGKTITNWNSIEYAFICVPTPLIGSGRAIRRRLDTDIIDEVCKKVYNKVDRIIIRSTIGPDQTAKYIENYSAIIWPEFLRERWWREDVDNPEAPMVVGGFQMHHFIKSIKCHKKIIEVKPNEAAMIKVARNAALAVKVGLANEFKNICDDCDLDYNVVAEFLGNDPNLGKTHWNVPGPDGKVGFGGTCLPKDLTHTSSLCYNTNNILKAAVTANKDRRSK